MLQIFALILVSWAIIWYFDKNNLQILGYKLTAKNGFIAFVLFVMAMTICVGGFLLRMHFAKEQYAFQAEIGLWDVLKETFYQFRSVLTEELLFRGVGLYLLIKKLGKSPAILISSIIFAIFHVVDFALSGQYLVMSLMFSFTFFMGLVLAYAFAQTRSIIFPLAIHMGWNLIQNFVFAEKPPTLFSLVQPVPVVTISYLAFFTMYFLPKILLVVLNFLAIRQLEPSTLSKKS